MQMMPLRRGAALAPMAGATDKTMRRISAEHGAVCTVSEMISAHGAHRAVLSRNAPHRLICDAGHGRKRGTAPQRHHLQMFVLL